MRITAYNAAMNFAEARVRADILKALAHPIRVLLVDELSRGDRCVSDLVAIAGVDQSNVSRHLTQLKQAGILSERREGARVMHHLQCPCILHAFACAVQVIREDAKRRDAVLEGVG